MANNLIYRDGFSITIMKISSFKVLNRKRIITLSVILVMVLQVVMVPTATGPANLEANYGTAQELDTFFQSVNQRNDQVDKNVIDELNFLRSIHEGNELDLSLLEAREVVMNNKDESENVVADIDDYETIVYDYSERGLKPTEVNDPEPIRADIIETMLNDADLYQDSFLDTALSIFTETYLIYWAYDANGNGTIDVSGCGDSAPPDEPCEEGVEEANLASTIWGASTAIITAWIESLELQNDIIQFIVGFITILDEGEQAWIPIDIDEDGNDEIRVRLVPVINDLLNDQTDLNPINGDVGLEANVGLAFELQELQDLNQTLDVAIVRGITYSNENDDDQTYVWGVNTQFPANETPDEYSLTVVIEEFIFTIGTDGSGGKDLYIPNSGFRKTADNDSLLMNGSNVFSFVFKEIPNSINE
ncbi:MAG: hypothetical protein ABGW86_02815, partial [Candidatus Poseidoniia archaeon]